MPLEFGPVSMVQQVADLRKQMRRLRIPPRVHTYTRTGPVTVSSGQAMMHNDTGLTLAVFAVRVTLGTEPSTQPVIVDVLADWTSMFGTDPKPQVAVGETVGDSTRPTFTQWLSGTALTVDVVQDDPDAADLHVSIAVA